MGVCAITLCVRSKARKGRTYAVDRIRALHGSSGQDGCWCVCPSFDLVSGIRTLARVDPCLLKVISDSSQYLMYTELSGLQIARRTGLALLIWWSKVALERTFDPPSLSERLSERWVT